MLTHLTGIFGRLYFGPYGALGALAPQIFTRPNSPINCISSRAWGAGRPQVGLCPIFLVIICYHIIRLSYDESEDDVERWDDQLSEVTLDAGQLVWALAFGSYTSHTKRHSTSLNWSSTPAPDLLLASGLQSGSVKIWHVRYRTCLSLELFSLVFVFAINLYTVCT